MAEKQQEKSGWLCTWDLARFLEFLPCSLRLGRESRLARCWVKSPLPTVYCSPYQQPVLGILRTLTTLQSQ